MSKKSKKKRNNEWLEVWILAVMCTIAGLWPISILVVGLCWFNGGKLFKKNEAKTKTPKTKSSNETDAEINFSRDEIDKLFNQGKSYTKAGIIVSTIMGCDFLSAFISSIYRGDVDVYISMLTALLILFGISLTPLIIGRRKTQKGYRYQNYLNVIGTNQLISIETIANITGIKREKIRKDLQTMLNKGVWQEGYLDLAQDMFFLTTGNPENNSASKDTKENIATILEEIQEINDAIDDPLMSEKIERIKELTGKILQIQKESPEKTNNLRSFLNYYLPTTIKILNAYEHLNAQGIEGENINAAKCRVEDMMDKVIKGFEKQLDNLFHETANDISAEVVVLEKMMEIEGLTSDQMTIG